MADKQADINEDAVRSAAAELVAAGQQALAIRCDVADEAEVAAMITQRSPPSVAWMRSSTTPAAVPPTSTVTVAVSMSPPPTVTPTAVPVTPTSPPAASPSLNPTNGGTPMPTNQPATGETQIRVIIGDAVLTGRLWDNATARDLIAQLPLTLTFNDFNRLEKIATLPRNEKTSLSTVHLSKGDTVNSIPGRIKELAEMGFTHA